MMEPDRERRSLDFRELRRRHVSLHMNQFEEADRYAVDLYGAVQDAYLQTRDHEVKKLHEEQW